MCLKLSLVRTLFKYIICANINTLLDCYTRVFGQSPLIDGLLARLTFKVKQEIQLQKDLIETMATLDMLFTKSGPATVNK